MYGAGLGPGFDDANLLSLPVRACHNMSLILSGCSWTAPHPTHSGARTTCLPGPVGVTLVLIAALFLAGCDRLPETYAPPEQRHPLEGFNPGPESMMVEMSDPGANPRIAKDVYPLSNPFFRWTAQNPTVRALVVSTGNLRFLADFAIWDDGLKTTGPVEIAYLVNNQVLEKVCYETPGMKHFEKVVPPAWISADSEATLAMSIDKVYVAPRDHMKYGVILLRLGLKP